MPTALFATTVNVYEVSTSKPVTLIGDVTEVPVRPPGDEVAV